MTTRIRWRTAAVVVFLSTGLFAQPEDLREKYQTRGVETARHIDRSIAMENVRDFAGALKEADAAVGLEPACPAAHFRRGNALAGLERSEDAAEAYRRCFDLSPERPAASRVQAAIGAGNVLLKLGKLDDAQGWFTRALLADPGNAAGLRGRVWLGISQVSLAHGASRAAHIAGLNALADDPRSIPPETVRDYERKARNETVRLLFPPRELPLYPAHEVSDLARVSTAAYQENFNQLVPEPQSGTVAVVAAGSRYLYLLDTLDKLAFRKVELPAPAGHTVAAGGRIWSFSWFQRSCLIVIDPVAGKVEKTIDLDHAAESVVAPFPSEGAVYIGFYERPIQRVEPATSRLTTLDVQGLIFADPFGRYLLIQAGHSGCSWLEKDQFLGRASRAGIPDSLRRADDFFHDVFIRFARVGGELLLSDMRFDCGFCRENTRLSTDGEWLILVKCDENGLPFNKELFEGGVGIVSAQDLGHVCRLPRVPGAVRAASVNPVTGQTALVTNDVVHVFLLDDGAHNGRPPAPAAPAVKLEGRFGSAVAWSPGGDYLVVAREGGGLFIYSNRLSEAEKVLSRTWWKRPEPEAKATAPPLPPAVASDAVPGLAGFAVHSERSEVSGALKDALSDGRSGRLPAWKETGTYPLTDELRSLLVRTEGDLAKDGEEGAAIYRLREALGKNPSAAWMDLYLADALRRTGQKDDAQRAYEECVRRDAGRTDLTRSALNGLGAMLAGTKQGLPALYCYAKSLRVDSGCAETLSAMRGLLAANGFREEAARLPEQADSEAFAAHLPSLPIPREGAPAPAPDRVYAAAVPSVLLLRTARTAGTGICIGEAGLLLTNDHVLDGKDRVDVYPFAIEGGKTVKLAKLDGHVIARWKDKDLALIRVRQAPATMVPLEVAGASPRPGEKVYAVGNPGLGEVILEQTISAGIVSAGGRNIEGQQYLQHTAAVNPGNSGGPLLNDRGQVAGVVTLKAGLEGVSFAIPVEEIRKLFPKPEAKP